MNRRLVAVVLLVAGAALAALGTFQPIFVQHNQAYEGLPETEFAVTAWEVRTTPPQVHPVPNSEPSTPLFGIPVLVAAALLVLAALFAVRGHRWARPVGVAGAAMQAGAAGVVLMFALFLADQGPPSPTETHSIGAGTWMMLAAAGIALAGALLAQPVPVVPAEPAAADGGPVIVRLDEEGADEDTPPLGFPKPDHPAGE